MGRSSGNIRLKTARQAAGYASQRALVEAMAKAAGQLGMRGFAVGERQVRRWESEAPGWPHPDAQRVLTHLLGQDMAQLGFRAPWDQKGETSDVTRRTVLTGTVAAVGLASVPMASATPQPATIAADFTTVTEAHRRMYWSVPPAQLHGSVAEHARLGSTLLLQTLGATRQAVATSLAETYLLAGRIEFFDLQEADLAADTFVQALQAAGEADDKLLGSAILAHAAFVPAWVGHRDAALERMRAARSYARRGPAPATLLAWLDAVEAEVETRCGNIRTALHLLGNGEDVLAADSPHPTPAWLDWFSAVRLLAFKGNTQLKAGHLPQARQSLLRALEDLPSDEAKQRSVILGDLAAVEAASEHPEEACAYALQALDQLEATWYATGMDRVHDVRRALEPWQQEQCVRDLDDRLYGWATTVSALQR
ncbi:transcriptional regulator [Actinacidiphila acididurans]|uniref:Transcriptional regulator n=1 Tax=Actinacidiphila acididurans TaxID=2784346 RepID=A0ABS2TXJ6_9ACTN|nr:transcriptional regulator [Actinacidiphila acididurans]MBM9508059.1 transcriptional regulator [Actinacidiphila acididurans]